MSEFWKDDLTEDQENALLHKVAGEIARRKLETPAILALEMHKPLSNVFAHSAIVFAPFVVPFCGFDFLDQYSNLFRKRENVERLIVLLEESRLSTSAKLES